MSDKNNKNKYLFELEIDNINKIILCHLDISNWSVAKYKKLLEQAKEAILEYSNYTFIAEVPDFAHRQHHNIIKRIGFEKVARSFNSKNQIIDIYELTDKLRLFNRDAIIIKIKNQDMNIEVEAID